MYTCLGKTTKHSYTGMKKWSPDVFFQDGNIDCWMDSLAGLKILITLLILITVSGCMLNDVRDSK